VLDGGCGLVGRGRIRALTRARAGWTDRTLRPRRALWTLRTCRALVARASGHGNRHGGNEQSNAMNHSLLPLAPGSSFLSRVDGPLAHR